MDSEDDRSFGLCKCCLQHGSFRSLWVGCDDNGMLHNYGEMLNECFSLHWQKPNNIHLEHICDDCIKHTEDAFSFRKKVLTCQEKLESYSELPSELEELLDPESGQLTVIVKVESIPELTLDEVTGEYEAVEYLEVDGNEEELVDDPEYFPQEQVVKKCPQKRRRNKYRNYSNDVLKECVDAVRSRSMSVAEAAAHYGVPRKTVASKILSEKRGEVTCVRIDKNHEMIKEVKTLLTYTNITPYKTRTAHFHCAYCSTDGPLFDDPDELRTHTRTLHAGERTQGVEQFLRPLWLNEVLKVDIENLQCIVCCVMLVSWNDMFKHLNEKHSLEFDEAYNRVIPYILSSEQRCALCKVLFTNYHQLDAHMNAHYNTYMCAECGDTFLSASRLKKHITIHEIGRYPCEQCGKMFPLEKYRKKHIEQVHKLQQKVPCLYCPERFHGPYPRHKHVMQCHPGKVKMMTCELCGKTFDWQPYFLTHIRRKHNKQRDHACSVCTARFYEKSHLRSHMKTHSKPRKLYARSYIKTNMLQSNPFNAGQEQRLLREETFFDVA